MAPTKSTPGSPRPPRKKPPRGSGGEGRKPDRPKSSRAKTARDRSAGVSRRAASSSLPPTPPPSSSDRLHLFEVVSEGSIAGVYVIQDGKFRYTNPSLARTFGYQREELEGGLGPADLTHPDDRAKVAEFIRRRVAGEVESVHYTFRGVRKDGSQLHCEVLGQLVQVEGKPAVAGTLLDITEREQARQELLESEAMFRGLAERSPSAIFINQGGKVVYANSAAIELLGYSLAELTDPGFDFLKLIAPESLELVRGNFRMHQQGADVAPYECRLLTRDGRAVDSLIATRLIQLEGELAIMGIITDLTARKQGERDLEHLLQDEQRHRKLAEAMARVGLSLTAQLELHELLDLICKEGTEVFGVSSALVWMLEGDRLVGVAGHGVGRSDFVGRRLSLQDPISLASRVVREATPAFVNQAIGSGQVNQVLLRMYRAKAILGVPLIRAGRAEGALILLDSDDPNRFGDTDLETAMVLAGQMALAVESAQLLQRDRHRLHQLSALIHASTVISSSLDMQAILTRVAEEMCTAIDATSAYICTFDSDTYTSTVVAEYYSPEAVERESDLGRTYDLEREFPGTVDGLQIGNAMVAQVDDPTLSESERDHMLHYGGQSTLTIPFESAGQVRAYAELWESRRPRQFSEEEIELCLAIGRQAAIALENGRLYQQAQEELAERWRAEKDLAQAVAQVEGALERAERLAATQEALRDSAAALNSTLDLDEVLDRILQNVGQVVPSDTVDIMMVESTDSGEMLVGVRGLGYRERGQEGWLETVRLPIQGIPSFHRLVQSRAPYAIPDVKRSTEWVEFPETLWIKSYAAAPIITKGNVVGILNLCSETAGFYQQADAELLQAFADQAAVAIENAQLFTRATQELAERQRAEREVRRLSEFNESILEEMADGVAVQDREGRFTYVNPAAAALFGRNREEMRGRHWTEFISPETQRLVEAADARRREGRSDRYEVQLLNKDGNHVPVLVSGRPRYEHGEFGGTVAVFTDISERKRTEEAEREFLRTKEEFLLSASHSLRTPLHTLMGFLELLAGGKVEDPARRQEFLGRALNDARHLAELLEDVLGTAQLESGSVELDPQPLRPVELLAETLASLQGLASDKQIELTWGVGEMPEGLQADRTRLRQALGNLVENAIHYSPPGTLVRVEAAAVEDGIEIRVVDQGPGISPADQAAMFEKPYLRAAGGAGGRGGVGLGLYLAHTIVEAHGGRLRLESQVAKGSTFTIFLPR